MKKIFAGFISFALFFCFMIVPVNAENYSKILLIVITDPDSNKTWNFKKEIRNTVFKIPQASKSVLGIKSIERNSEATVSLAKYLKSTFDKKIKSRKEENGSATIDSDIIITTGLRWYLKGSDVKITRVTGSVINKGYFYAANKRVSWGNPGSGEGGVFYPTVSSWSKSVSDDYGLYMSSMPPYSILDVTIYVSGMGGSRKLSVTFNLNSMYT
ncbi:hypothetical protein [Eggerthia catenaformis]|uniref:hypothetical protein n=1 Tax=Eggerthia catenaformis TaxID=31973 RepID=UPI003C700E3E